MQRVSNERTQQWLREFSAGEEQSYRKLYHHFYNGLLLYGKTITEQQPIVEDQIQEVFIWLYHHPQKCRAIQNIEAYLYSSLRKNILLVLRKDANQLGLKHNYLNDQDPLIHCVEDQWIQSGQKQQQHDWLAKQLDQLPPRMQEVIYLRYYRCLSYEEIAAIMSVPPQVAQNFAGRALKKMRQALPQLQQLLWLFLALWVTR